ncbi:MAG: CPBP family intramembrane metalloprotease [Proteobacteria bacterium]|nr:CPBP family intramembrane metalloprotease [Pseudomonadota bacterium]
MNARRPFGDRIVWLFIGPHGLRLPWSILLVLMAIGAAQILSVVMLQAFGVHMQDVSGDSTTAIGTIKGASLVLASIIAATLFMAVIERRSLDAYYLDGPRAILRATQGAAVGLALIAMLVGGQIALGALSFDGLATIGQAALLSGVEWGVAFVLVALLEEMIFRAYLLARLARSFGFRGAAIATPVLFAAAHFSNLGEGLIGLVSVVLAGLVLSYAIWKTGSLWWAFGWHAAWDWGETYLFGAADSGAPATGSLMITHPHGPEWLSGGATGPEGSVLCFVVLALAALVVRFLPAKADAH